jgi:hypothetical protein
MDLFGRAERKQVKKGMKRAYYTLDVARLENLGGLARGVWQSPPGWPRMHATADGFFVEADDLMASIQRYPAQNAIQHLTDAVNNIMWAAQQCQWWPAPMGGWMPDPGSEFSRLEFPLDSACIRLVQAANEHLNPQRNEGNEHMFRPQFKWQDNNKYY